MTHGFEASIHRTDVHSGLVRPTDPAVAFWLGLAAAAMATLFVAVHWSLLVVAAAVVLYLAWMEEEWFLLLIIFLIPMSWVRTNGALRDVMTPLRLLVLLGFFGGRLWRGQLKWKVLMASRVSSTSLCLWLVALVSVVLGPIGWTHDSIAQSYRLASWIGYYFFGLAWIDSERRLRGVIMALLASVCLLGIVAATQEVAGGYTHLWLYFNPQGPGSFPWVGRAASILGSPNSLAAYLDLSLPFALASCLIGRGILRKIGAGALALGMLALAFSQSLGGLASFCAVLALAIYCFVQPWRKRILLFAGLLMSMAIVLLARKILNPVHFAAGPLALAYDVTGRLFLYQAAWLLFLHRPLLGVGLGNYGPAAAGLLPAFTWIAARDRTEAWNLYLNLLAEVGLVGAAIFFYVLFLAWRRAWKKAWIGGDPLVRIVAFGTLGAVAGVLVHGCVDYLLFAQYGTLLWLIIALSQLRQRDPRIAAPLRTA